MKFDAFLGKVLPLNGRIVFGYRQFENKHILQESKRSLG